MHVAGSAAMQPVCSLRLQHVRFKQAAQAWGHKQVWQFNRRSLQTQACASNTSARRIKAPRRSTVCADAAVPHIPFPGDNQSGAILAALSQDEDSPSSSSPEEARAIPSKSPNNGGPPDNKPEPRIPHRWRIVGMMALAFVLCNMDKVCTTCYIAAGPVLLEGQSLYRHLPCCRSICQLP